MNELAGVAVTVFIGSIGMLAMEWRMRRLQAAHDAEMAQLTHYARQARIAEREAQQATVRTKMAHDRAVAQRDLIAQDMADLRTAYLDLAAQHRRLLSQALANGLRNVKLFHTN